MVKTGVLFPQLKLRAKKADNQVSTIKNYPLRVTNSFPNISAPDAQPNSDGQNNPIHAALVDAVKAEEPDISDEIIQRGIKDMKLQHLTSRNIENITKYDCIRALECCQWDIKQAVKLLIAHKTKVEQLK